MTDKLRAVIFDDEIMQGLFQAGFISATVFTQRDIFLWVDAQTRILKISKHQAMIKASYKWKMHYNTIDKACKKFKTAK